MRKITPAFTDAVVPLRRDEAASPRTDPPGHHPHAHRNATTAAIMLCSVFIVASPRAMAVPTVTNVAAYQRQDASRLVDITYDLASDPPDDPASPLGYEVQVELRLGGSRVDEPSVFGNVGPFVLNGTKRLITWNTAIDWPDTAVERCQATIHVVAVDTDGSVTTPTPLTLNNVERGSEGRVLGTVRSLLSGGGIPLASLTLERDEFLAATTTDGSGKFDFLPGVYNLYPGKYTLTVIPPGHYRVIQSVLVREDSSTSVDVVAQEVSLSRNAASSVVDVRGAFSGPSERAYYLVSSGLPLMPPLPELFLAVVDWENPAATGDLEWRIADPENTGHYDVIYRHACSEDPCYAFRPFIFGPPRPPCGSGVPCLPLFNRGETLIVAAIESSVTTSTYMANLEAAWPPPGILSPLLYPLASSHQTLKYTTPSMGAAKKNLDKSAPGADNVPDSKPLFGNRAFKFAQMWDTSATVDGSGEATTLKISVPLTEKTGTIPGKKTKIAGYELSVAIGGQLSWRYDDGTNLWWPGGGVSLSATADADVPPKPIYFTFAGVPCYFIGHVTLGLTGSLDIYSWSDEGDPMWKGTLALDPFPYAEAAIGTGVRDLVAVEGYLGGGAGLTLSWPYDADQGESALDELKLFMAGGVRVIVWVFSYNFPVLEYTWKLMGNKSWSPGNDPKLGTLGVMPRCYVDPPESYAVFNAGPPPANLPQACSPTSRTWEIPLQENVFDYSTPEIAVIDGTTPSLLAAWVYDNNIPARSPSNRTELRFSTRDNTDLTDTAAGAWTDPIAVEDDGTADFNPQLASLTGGKAIIVWEDLAGLLVEPEDSDASCSTTTACTDPCESDCQTACNNDDDPQACRDHCPDWCEERCIIEECRMGDLKEKMDITVARFDVASPTTWDVAQLSGTGADDACASCLDRTPRVASAGEKSMMTWVQNSGSDAMGSASANNTLFAALYDQSVDSPPWPPAVVEIPAAAGAIAESALAFDGTNAVLVYTGVTDGVDPATLANYDLFCVTYRNGTWDGAVTNLTNDPYDPDNPDDPNNKPVADGNPQIAFDVTGQPLVIWYRDGLEAVDGVDLPGVYRAHVTWTSDTSAVALSNKQLISTLESEGRTGPLDFELLTGPAGSLAMVWQDASEDLVDMWWSFFVPNNVATGNGEWSLPERLTCDDSMEQGISPVLVPSTGDLNLVAIYNKAKTQRTTRTVTVDGEDIEIDNVPVRGQTDLYVVQHTIDKVDAPATLSEPRADPSVDPLEIVLSPPNPKAGQTASIVATVRNLAVIPTILWKATFYLGSPEPGNEIGAPVSIDLLLGGDQVDVSVDWTVPSTESSSPPTIYVKLEPVAGSATDLDQNVGNNEAQFTPQGKPDLVPTSLGVQEAESVRIFTLRVSNDGLGPVTNVDWVLRRDDPENGPQLMRDTITQIIRPGAYRDVSYAWNVDGVSQEAVDVFAVVDPDGAIEEFDEDNNMTSAAVDTASGNDTGCGDGTCTAGETFCTCPTDCTTPPQEICGNEIDDDCDGCDDSTDADCGGVERFCSNRRDDDCDGLIDGCDFNDCPGPESNCTNGRDDDCDGLVDCADENCNFQGGVGIECCYDGIANTELGCVDAASAQCGGTENDCANGVDDDCDSLTDCADPDCSAATLAETCDNGLDDDCDGCMDWDDSDCPGGTEADCTDGVDNDCDGCVDSGDSDCPGGTEADCTDGLDNDCDGRVDCSDPDCILATESGLCDNGIDDDCDGWTDACDTDCGNLLTESGYCSNGIDDDCDGCLDDTDADCPGGTESDCFNMRDDDCDGLIDCADSADCGTMSESGCCADGEDNDGDLAVDLFDSDCGGREVDCPEGMPTCCSDSLDNDGDGLIDLCDPNCNQGSEWGCCGDGVDNDSDGCVDRNDSDCPGGTESDCTDGLDNDCDGSIDCADAADCNWTTHPDTTEANCCADGIDNDGDSLIDLCDPDCNPGTELGCCSDGEDNDGDALVDVCDPDCLAISEATCCSDGVDNDRDGCTDDADSDCGATECSCNDGWDDDCDGLYGPCDPDCAPAAPLPEQLENAAGTLVTNIKNRMLSFRGGDPGRSRAVRVTFLNLPGAFAALNGSTLWVGAPIEYSEAGARGYDDPCTATWSCGANSFLSSTLTDTPAFRDWGDDPGFVHVRGELIIPHAVYRIQFVDISCDLTNPESFSPSLNIGTAKWGDVVDLKAGQWVATETICAGGTNQGQACIRDSHCPDSTCGLVSVLDLIGMLAKFSGTPGAPSKTRMDLLGVFTSPSPIVDGKITISDTVAVLTAFGGEPYPFAPPKTATSAAP